MNAAGGAETNYLTQAKGVEYDHQEVAPIVTSLLRSCRPYRARLEQVQPPTRGAYPMRPPPPLADLPRYPVTVAVGVLAVAATVAWHSGRDVSFLAMTPDAWDGQPWRLVTSAFPHGNALHLLFNLYWLWVFGSAVEEVFGHLRTAAAMLLFAAVSAAAEYAVFRGGIGLSGVGYGLFGMLWVLSAKDARFEDVVDAKTVALFVAWFFVCIALTVSGILPVANVAHAMGAIQGLLLGGAITASPQRRPDVVGTNVMAIVLVVVAATVGRPYINFSGGSAHDLAEAAYRDLAAGRNESAAALYERALRSDPRQASTWYNYAIACQRLGRDADATEAYRRACQLEPGTAGYRQTLCEWLAYTAFKKQDAGADQEAARLYREALSLDERRAPNWFNLGIVYERSGRPASALQAYEKAAELDPQDQRFRASVQRLRPTAKQP